MATRVEIDEVAFAAYVHDPAGPIVRMLERQGFRVQSVATRLCPVDTGRLQASITFEVLSDSRGLVVFIGSNVEYAIYVEFDQPYLRPALSAVA